MCSAFWPESGGTTVYREWFCNTTNGSAISRSELDFMTVAKGGRILGYVQGAHTGGVAARHLQKGGK